MGHPSTPVHCRHTKQQIANNKSSKKMGQMWFDICILRLTNEHSCSSGGKSHTGLKVLAEGCEGELLHVCPGVRHRLAPAVPLMWTFRFPQITCFLFNLAKGNKKWCMRGVNVMNPLTRLLFFFTFTYWILKCKTFFFPTVNTFLGEPQEFNHQVRVARCTWRVNGVVMGTWSLMWA